MLKLRLSRALIRLSKWWSAKGCFESQSARRVPESFPQKFKLNSHSIISFGRDKR
jgi:hypothetical protein